MLLPRPKFGGEQTAAANGLSQDLVQLPSVSAVPLPPGKPSTMNTFTSGLGRAFSRHRRSWQGIRVSSFSIGFGPVLLQRQRRGVQFALRAIPLGGFVAFADDDEDSTITKNKPQPTLQPTPAPAGPSDRSRVIAS